MIENTVASAPAGHNGAAPAGEQPIDVYTALLSAVFREACAGSDHGEPWSDVVTQLVAYRKAASIFEYRDAAIASLRGEQSKQCLPEGIERAVVATRDQLEAAGWGPSEMGALKTKRVFGHKGVVKYITLPNVPSSAGGSCVYVRVDTATPAQETSSRFSSVLRFNGQRHALAEIEESGLAVVLALHDIEPGAHVIISPFLVNRGSGECQAESDESLRNKLVAMVSEDVVAWRDFFSQHKSLLRSEASANTLTSALKLAAEQSSNQHSAQLKRKLRSGEHGTTVEELDAADHTATSVAKTDKGDDAGQKAYGVLLAAVLRELGLYQDVEGGWLDAKKGLLIYHHLAALTEHKEAVICAIRGEGATPTGLPAAHQRAISLVRGEILQILAAAGGQKVKRIFSHDHVIRFHQPPKGLPISRGSCVFLRERPCTTDHLRKTPSLFRDVVRFKCAGSPLMLLEDHGLALVLTVTTYTPRAFMVISPLLEMPELVSQLAGQSWTDIQQSLKEHLTSFIARESPSWCTFVQRHAHLITKDSLRIIQKVLKSHNPGMRQLPGGDSDETEGACMRLFFEELAMSREDAMGRHSEAIEREAHAKVAVQTAQDEAEANVHAQTTVATEAKRAKIQAEERASKCAEEVEGLIEANSELLYTTGRLRKRNMVIERKCIKKSGKVLAYKQRLKNTKRKLEEQTKYLHERAASDITSAKEQAAKAQEDLAEAQKQVSSVLKENARLASERVETVQRSLVDVAQAKHEARVARQEVEAAKKDALVAFEEQSRLSDHRLACLQRTLAEAQQREAQARAELQLETNAKAVLTSSNVLLRSEAARREEAAHAAEKENCDLRRSEAELREAGRLKTDECAELARLTVALQAEVAASVVAAKRSEEMSVADQQAAEKSRHAETLARASLQAKLDEVSQLMSSCSGLGSELKKAESEIHRLRVSLSSAEHAASAARAGEVRARAELELKTETLSRVTQANGSLRSDAARSGELEIQLRAVREHLGKAQERQAELQAEVQIRAGEAVAKAREEFDVEAAGMSVRVREAEDAASAAVLAAAESRKGESCARADLQAKTEEAERLTAACATLQARLKREMDDAAVLSAVAAETRRSEISARADMELMAKRGSQLTEANVLLRAEASTAREIQSRAESLVAAADRAASEARDAEASAQTALQRKADEALGLSALCEDLRLKLTQKEQEATGLADRTAMLQSIARSSRNAELNICSDLQAKSEEASRLTLMCATSRAAAEKAKDEATIARERAATAEREMTTMRAELQLKTDALDKSMAANVDCRAKASSSREEASEAVRCLSYARRDAEEAARAASRAQEAESDVVSKYEKYDSEMESLNAANLALRDEASSAHEAVRLAEARVVDAVREAEERRSAEIRIAADLQVQRAEVSRLSTLCIQTNADCAKLRLEVSRSADQAAKAGELLREARAELSVALESSELTGKEIQRLARKGVQLTESTQNVDVGNCGNISDFVEVTLEDAESAFKDVQEGVCATSDATAGGAVTPRKHVRRGGESSTRRQRPAGKPSLLAPSNSFVSSSVATSDVVTAAISTPPKKLRRGADGLKRTRAAPKGPPMKFKVLTAYFPFKRVRSEVAEQIYADETQRGQDSLTSVSRIRRRVNMKTASVGTKEVKADEPVLPKQ